MSSLGILGGSFDPVHIAHLIVAERVREALALDRVLLVPVGRHPFEERELRASPAERLEMLSLAAEDKCGLEVSGLEIAREGRSYTVDTLTELHRTLPGAELHLILGSDAYRLFNGWRRPDEIRRLARLVVVPRAGDRASSGAPAAEDAGPEPIRVAVPHLEISASEIRRRVARGQSVRHLTPEPVRTYILERGLYLQ